MLLKLKYVTFTNPPYDEGMIPIINRITEFKNKYLNSAPVKQLPFREKYDIFVNAPIEDGKVPIYHIK